MLASLAIFGRLPRDVRLYLFAFNSIAFAYFGILGVLFNLYLLRLGHGPEFIGLLIGGGQLVWGAAALPAAMLGARLGNRNALIAGTICSGVGIALMLLNEALPRAAQDIWLTVTWMLNWVGTAIFIVNSSPYVMATTNLEQRPHAFALNQAGIALFGFTGALIAGALPGLLTAPLGVTLDHPAAYRTALWLVPLGHAVATVFFLQTRPLPPQSQQSAVDGRTPLPLLVICFVGVVLMLQAFGEGVLRAFINIYLDAEFGVPTTRIGGIMGTAQLLSVGTALWAPTIMARWGAPRTVMLVGGFGGAASLTLAALVGHWVAAALAFTGVMIVVSVASTARNVFSQEAVTSQWRTTMSAALTIGIALGWSIAAVLGGYIIAGWGYAPLFWLGVLAAMLSVVLVIAYQRHSATHLAPAQRQEGNADP